METNIIKIYAKPDGSPFDSESKTGGWLMLEESGQFAILNKDGTRERAFGMAIPHKEIQYPPNWPNAFKYRWEPLSKLPAPSGYVCIGKGGTGDSRLVNYFNENHRDLYSYECGTFKPNWSGIDKDQDYFVTKETWEKTFKEFLTKEKEMNKIYTKADPAAREIVEKMCAARWEGNWTIYEKYPIWLLGANNGRGVQTVHDNYSELDSFKEVPLHEFIYALGQIPEKIKEKEINILPWPVIVRGEKCSIGCKKDVSLESLKGWCNDLPDCLGIKTFQGIDIKVGKYGFMAEGKFVRWEVLESFKKEL